MATLDNSLNPTPPGGPAATHSRLWERVDAWSAWASEYINPILVKETRQALKSRQFLVTFALLLLAGWLWSISVILWGPGVYYGGGGTEVFSGYFCILCFPLIMVIPFGAYRSLASEWEDGTYDLMSISTLSARQIVTGKLGSSVLQMIVYLSAIAPCLAFTYLLRGIDLITIFYLLFWLCMNCLLLTFLALAMATITRQRMWQVMVSVILICGCAFNFMMGIAFVLDAVLDHGMIPFDDKYTWIASGALLTGVLAYMAMFLLIARARLMFPTENRSTALRVTMLVHFGLFAGWWGWAWLFEWRVRELPIPAFIFVFLSTLHWYLMGMFMTGEAAELSPRVKRDLPQSFLGRVFLTWFNPGSGTGYVFAVANTLAAAALAYGSLKWMESSILAEAGRSQWVSRWLSGAYNGIMVVVCYLTIYLGIGRLLIRYLRKYFHVDMFVGVIMHLGLFAAANLVPLLIQAAIVGEIDDTDYNLLQALAPVWTLIEAVEPSGRASFEIEVLWLLLPVVAILVFLLNLPSVSREVQQLRIAKPTRVEEDDAELHPTPPPQPTSPWD